MPTSNAIPEKLADDLLTGAPAIADFIGWPTRKVYHAIACGYLPVGRVGPILIARKSQLKAALSAPAKYRPTNVAPTREGGEAA
jgi:hypothetical protein